MASNGMDDIKVMEALLDGRGTTFVSKFHYEDYLDHNNVKVIHGIYSHEDRRNFLLPGNPDSSEKDWWLMYAVNALGLADAESISRYLKSVKNAHKELYFTTNDERNMAKRLNLLSRMGFLEKYLYVIGTNVDIDDAQKAYEITREKLADKMALQTELSKPAVSVDDEFMDENSEDEIDFVTYSTGTYSKYLQMKKKENFIRGKNGYAVLCDDGRGIIKKYFGKAAHLVTLYGIEMESHRNLKDRFGVNIPFYKGDTAMKLTNEQIGDAAVGYVSSVFSDLPTFHNFKSGRVQCGNGLFMVPSELEFKIKEKDGTDYAYNCGIFKSFYSRMEGRTLPSHDKGRVHTTIENLKNYLGVKGITKKGRDAFVVIVVNDSEDLHYFADALVKTTRINKAEINRIFFTGEGIVKSSVGVSRVMRVQVDDDVSREYHFEPIRLPVV